jgi:outer membrane protein assembly factor BamB
MGVVSAYTKAGKKVWSFTAGDAVYSSPVMADDKVIFGCNDGWLYALDATTGKLAWVNKDGTYTVESKPFAWNGKVYYGAWDQYIRCVNAKDGKLVWQQICEGSRIAKAAKRYYSPADAMPAVAEGKLMIADRNMMLTILDAQTGEPAGSIKGVSATGVSEDGKFCYLRKTNGDVAKIDGSAKEIWSVRAHVGFIPTAPIEKNGVVYVSSGKGIVSAIAADSGKILWQYQGSPQLFVMSSVVSDGANAYVTAFDGSLTAIKCRAR